MSGIYDLSNKQGLYLLVNEDRDRVYLGSTVRVRTRVLQHQSLLERGVHPNAHLQHTYDRDGSLTAIPIYVKEGEDVKVLEQQLIDEFIDTNVLLNIARDASAPMLGRKQSPESIAKGVTARTGVSLTPEHRAKLSEYAKARGMPRAVIEAGAAARVGKKLSLEHIEKVRETSIERMRDPAARENLSRKNIGIPHTPEAITLMKEKCALREQNPEYVKRRNEALMARHTREREAKLALTSTGT